MNMLEINDCYFPFAFTDNIKIRMLEKKLPLIAPRFLKATGTSIVAGLMNVKKSTLAPA